MRQRRHPRGVHPPETLPQVPDFGLHLDSLDGVLKTVFRGDIHPLCMVLTLEVHKRVLGLLAELLLAAALCSAHLLVRGDAFEVVRGENWLIVQNRGFGDCVVFGVLGLLHVAAAARVLCLGLLAGLDVALVAVVPTPARNAGLLGFIDFDR